MNEQVNDFFITDERALKAMNDGRRRVLDAICRIIEQPSPVSRRFVRSSGVCRNTFPIVVH